MESNLKRLSDRLKTDSSIYTLATFIKEFAKGVKDTLVNLDNKIEGIYSEFQLIKKKGIQAVVPVKDVDYFDGVNGVKGKDGYSPIKNVDYFDGRDGVDGLNGKDGKTPIKGVDYFDGKNGVDGKNGKDGKDGRDGKDGSPDSPYQIKEKLELLKGEDRLDSSAIKNLPSNIKNSVNKIISDGTVSLRVGSKKGHFLDIVKAGSNISFSESNGEVTISSSGGGGEGGVSSVDGQTGDVDLSEVYQVKGSYLSSYEETDPVWESEKINYSTTLEASDLYEPKNSNIQSHISNTSNPHSVTASQIGAVTESDSIIIAHNVSLVRSLGC